MKKQKPRQIEIGQGEGRGGEGRGGGRFDKKRRNDAKSLPVLPNAIKIPV